MTDKCKECGSDREMTEDEFQASRNDLFRRAHSLLRDVGFDDPEVGEVLDVASFLEGSE